MQLPISLNLESADIDEDAKENFYNNFFRFCVMCKENICFLILFTKVSVAIWLAYSVNLMQFA